MAKLVSKNPNSKVKKVKQKNKDKVCKFDVVYEKRDNDKENDLQTISNPEGKNSR